MTAASTEKKAGAAAGFWLLAFTVSATLLLAFFWRNAQLYDNDAYYHLTIARAYAHEGILHELPWARFSLMADGFGDKELLFHVLLAPFAALAPDPVRGGQIALALLLGAVFATIALFARGVLGRWALLLPFWLAFASTEVAWRCVRLRPEILSLLVLLWALWAMARGRFRLLGLLAAVYALGYTAFHAFAGLCVLVALYEVWSHRRLRPGLLLYPALGLGVGLVAHPNFPKNLDIWVVQSLEFFRQKAQLDVGTEIHPNTTDVLLLVNLGWLLGLAVLWRSSRTRAGDEEGGAGAREMAETFGVGAAAFAGLYLLMSRFSLYAMPLVTLWMLFELQRRGRRPGGPVRLPGSERSVPFVAAVAVCLLVALPEARRQWVRYDERTDPGPARERIVDRERFAAALPDGATVAATWQQTGLYMLWAPQARYLNVLDPVFLAVQDPTRHRVQERVFAGSEPDVPLAVATALDSRYLAVSAFVNHDLMRARLRHDPRVATRYEGLNLLWEILPGLNDSFLLAWRASPDPGAAAPQDATALAGWRPYPRLPGPGAVFEGFVDLERFGDERTCRLLAQPLPASAPETWWLQLDSAGPAAVAWNGTPRVRSEGDGRAVLGAGITFPVELAPGDNVLSLRACPPDDPEAPFGFYLSRVPEPPDGAPRGAGP